MENTRKRGRPPKDIKDIGNKPSINGLDEETEKLLLTLCDKEQEDGTNGSETRRYTHSEIS